jgi:hypothetical protein
MTIPSSSGQILRDLTGPQARRGRGVAFQSLSTELITDIVHKARPSRIRKRDLRGCVRNRKRSEESTVTICLISNPKTRCRSVVGPSVVSCVWGLRPFVKVFRKNVAIHSQPSFDGAGALLRPCESPDRVVGCSAQGVRPGLSQPGVSSQRLRPRAPRTAAMAIGGPRERAGRACARRPSGTRRWPRWLRGPDGRG